MEVVVDTSILRAADVHLDENRRSAAKMAVRLALLQRIRKGETPVLISHRLAREYMEQVSLGKNDVVKAFMEQISKPDGANVVLNWPAWPHSDRAKMRECRFPAEDEFVLRTAVRPRKTCIYSEESRMLRSDRCVYKKFGVHVELPAKP